MSRIHNLGERPERRFVVTIDAMRIWAGYFTMGDVLTETMLDGRADRLVELGAIAEDDYALAEIGGDERKPGEGT